MRTIIEPFRIKTVEPIRMTSAEDRRAALTAAQYNVFGLRARDVMIDLLTDSGTGAMSTHQWAAMMLGDESYAGSESFFDMRDAVRNITGYEHVFPVHQGRAAERILFHIVGGHGKVVPSNTHFDTTRANIEYTGADARDIPVADAHQPSVERLFKGNMDIDALAELLATAKPGTVPVGMLTVTNNTVGGQPVSMANIRAVSELYHRHGIPFFLDAARFAENAYLISRYEKGYENRPLIEIAREMFSLADGCMVSAKKDGLVNIGGFIALNDGKLAAKVRDLLILTEGFPTYGGLAGRDMAALAQGLREVLDHDYLEYRHASATYLATRLDKLGVPTVKPAGIHAVYVDARAFLDHIPPEMLPGQSLVCELYLKGGIRAVEVGTLMFGGTDPQTGWAIPTPLDLVRLTLPRRVYTQSHFDWVVETFAEIVAHKGELPGYRIREEAPILRAFTAHLEPVPVTAGV
jgi:tryptophanase